MTNSVEQGNAILEYYQGITDGTIVVGRDVRALYERIIDGLENGQWFYDHKKAVNVIRFFERYVHHNKGKLAPQRITLELWQKATLSLIFGIVDADGRRQFTQVVLMVGRKMGKSLIAGGIMTFLAFTGEFGSELYYLAPKLAQADLCYQATKFNIDVEPDLSKRTKSTKTGLYIKESNTTLVKLPFAERTSDGFNPAGFIADEAAAWPAAKGLQQWEVMISGTGAREQPLALAISSENYITDGIWDELVKRGTAFLKGHSKEQHLLPILYRIDDYAKWDDITELQKSLPGLGVSVPVRFMLDEIATAHESISKKHEFIVKYCNLKQTSTESWVSATTLRKSFNIGDKTPEMYEGKPWHQRMLAEGKIDEDGNHFTLADFSRSYGIAGVDLSQTMDLTAVCFIVQKEGITYYFSHFFLPSAKLEEATARDGIPYQIYIDKGWLSLSGENFVDFNDCYNWLVDLRKKYNVYTLGIGIDRWCAQYIQAQLEGFSYYCETVRQGTNLTGVFNRTEGEMLDGTLQCADGCDLMKIHWLDACIRSVGTGGLKQLEKITQNAHIDGVAALIDAMCVKGNLWEKYKFRLANPERE